MADNDSSTNPSADDLLALNLAGGMQIAHAANAAGVSESTAYRRKREPAFQAKVNQLRNGLVEVALGRLLSAATAAADELNALCATHPDGNVRLRAATKIIELGARLRETTE